MQTEGAASQVHGYVMAVASETIRNQMRARDPSVHANMVSAALSTLSTAPQAKPKASLHADDIVRGDRFMCIKELCHKVGMGKSTIYRWIDDGQFPEGVKLASQMVRWRESVIDAWMASLSSDAR
ncbi:helix-turn-helix transcriptional regulator [Hyphomicrobium sp.]|jgi:prophage regulatory protein|uniref:helix-turn-helix transcriptional regulator n=1 Tax=Hyphomicrobium sp. TaxID=82 RepID=UPI003562856B